jgi:leucyl-tRNA synthetase
MSKSRGNVVNPEDITVKYGADTLRLYLLFMGPYEATMPWDPKGVEGMWRFLNRAWRLVSINQLRVAGCELKEKENPVLKIRNSPAGRAGRQFAIEQLAHRTIKKVTEDIEHLKFNTAIAALMEYVNGLTANNFEFRISNFEFSKTLVLLLAPFAPFMAEELWTKVLKQPYSVHQQPWPKFEPALAQEEEKVIIVQVNGKLRGQISTRHVRRNTQHEIEQLVQTDPQIAKYLAGRTIKKTIYVPGKLINFVV